MNSERLHTRDSFNALLASMEREHGTYDTCMQFLQALATALRATSFRGGDDLHHQFESFYELFATLKPRMAIIQHYLDTILERLDAEPKTDGDTLIDNIVAAIDGARHDNDERTVRLRKLALHLLPSRGKVLIHGRSRTVLDTLDLAHRTHKRFEVILAEQESSRTLDIAKFLKDRGIPFIAAPEYMLSSLEVDINCLLIGAITLKQDLHFVVDAGTKAVVSEMRIAKIPVHLMMTTNKFSYWRTKQANQTVKTIKSIAHPHADFSFDRVKFSHDRLPLELVDRIITEEGGFTPDELRDVYQQKLIAYRSLHAKLARHHEA